MNIAQVQSLKEVLGSMSNRLSAAINLVATITPANLGEDETLDIQRIEYKVRDAQGEVGSMYRHMKQREREWQEKSRSMEA